MRRNNLLRKAAAYSLAIAMLTAGALTGYSEPASETAPATEASVTTRAPKENETQMEAAKTKETTGMQVAEAVSKVENKTGEKVRVDYNICFLGNSQSVQLYQEFRWNAENIYKDDLNVTYIQSDSDVSKQTVNLEDLIAQDVGVTITTPCDTTAINSTLEEAVNAGIKVVLLCATVDSGYYDSLVTVDEKGFGAIGAQWLVDQLDGKDNIVVLNDISSFSTSTLRYGGVQSVFEKYPDIKVLAAENANWDYAVARTVTADLLVTYPEIDGVQSQGGTTILRAIDSFNAIKRDLVPMTGEDNNGYLKAYINSNMEGITISRPTWLARMAIENAIKLMDEEDVKKDDIYPVMTIKTEKVPEHVHQNLSDDVWCSTELPEDVLKSVFSNQ